MRIALNFFLLMSILGFILTINEFVLVKVYPSQFIYNQSDLFMDFFNTAFQQTLINTPFGDWKTIYAPFALGFSQAALSLISGGEIAEVLNAYDLRNEFSLAFGFLLTAFLASSFFFVDLGPTKTGEKAQLLLLSFSSMPVLFLIERGNLLFLALPLIFIFCNPNSRLDKFKVLALLVSIKIYFLLFIFCFKKKEVNASSILKFLLTLISVNLIALACFPSDFTLFYFVNNMFSFDKVSHPFIEIVGLNYSLPSIVEAALVKIENSKYFGLQNIQELILTFDLVSFFSLPFCALVLWSVKKANSFMDKYILIALWILYYFGDGGGYLGVLLIPIMFNYYNAGDKGLFVLANLCLLNIHLGDVVSAVSIATFYSPIEGALVSKVNGIDAYSFLRPLILFLLLCLVLKRSIENEMKR